MCFDFMTAARVVFGPGRLREVGVMTASLGRRVLVVTGRTPARAHTLLALLQKEGVDTVTFGIPREPEIDMVREGSGLARAESCDCVIGLGGGAALDAAKAIALLAANPGDVLDYLEIIGQGRQPGEPALPFIAIPTTAGTGSEVTSNSVLISPEDRVKVSLRSPLMLAKAAVVDPELTYDLPPRITATTGLDALTQLIEPFVSRKANALTDGICREGMTRVARSLRTAFARGRDVQAREDMAVAGLFGGLALANAGLGAVHGIAGPLGGMVSAPHGALCAALLPKVVAVNLRALRERDPESEVLARYDIVARILTDDPRSLADDLGGWLEELAGDLGIAGLAAYGVTSRHIPELAEKAARASSMKGNPIELTPEEIASIVESAL